MDHVTKGMFVWRDFRGMEILGEKSGEKEVLIHVWLEREDEKNVVGLGCFPLELKLKK